MLLSLRGSQCIYQGEELGLGEADVPFEALQDPYGKTFWPEFKGRDGCRTPMPWRDGTRAGFTSSRHPWLPIPEEHRARAVSRQQGKAQSALERVRHFMAWRQSQPVLREGAIAFHDAPAGVLAFTRSLGDVHMFCAFNLKGKAVSFTAPVTELSPVAGHGFSGKLTKDKVQLPAREAFFGLSHSRGG